jgi:hypothetical protein
MTSVVPYVSLNSYDVKNEIEDDRIVPHHGVMLIGFVLATTRGVWGVAHLNCGITPPQPIDVIG